MYYAGHISLAIDDIKFVSLTHTCQSRNRRQIDANTNGHEIDRYKKTNKSTEIKADMKTHV